MEIDDHELIPEFQDFYSRIADRVNSGTILRDLPTWICRNTSLKGRPWSFKDHEFQIAIAKDQKPRKVVKKCSQVGLTELQIRLVLAYLRVSNGRSSMYVLPYTKMALKISQSRIEPVIEGSPSLSKSVQAGANSAGYKRIGNSHLYVGGADKATEAISSPLDRLDIDERDFCRERVLGIYSSRMRHTEDGEGIRNEFSTPTISNYGISAAYERSDQKRYLCKCLHCGENQAPDFFKQVVIPGFDKEFKELDKEDFMLHRYNFEASYIRCVRCGKELDSSLMVASTRQWVAKYPGRPISGYAVKPYDLYKYNATPRIILQYPEYPMQQDYWNFVHGEELDTNDNKINDSIVDKSFTGETVFEGSDFCVGIDVGKTCHVFVAKKVGVKHCVVAKYKLKLEDDELFTQVCEILDRYKFSVCVIDAQPDLTLPKKLQDKYGVNMVFACYYVKTQRNSLSYYEVKDDGIVNAARTRGFDHMVKSVNNHQYEFMRCDDAEKKEIREHLQQVARIESPDDEGEKVAKWVKLSDMDHFFHALFYTHLAMAIRYSEYSVADTVGIMTLMPATLGASKSVIDTSSDLKRALKAYGFG